MHVPLTLNQTFWTLTFAAQLTLLVVLTGRDRARRFPCFTVSIALYAVRLLAEVLLNGRLSMIPYRTTMLILSDLMVLAGLLVAVEIAQRAFGALAFRPRLIGASAALLVAAVPTIFLGKWPAAAAFGWGSRAAVLTLLQLFAQKADLFMDVLVIAVCVLVLVFGKRVGAGWRSHTRQIVVGQALVAASWLGIQVAWMWITTHMLPRSQEEYERLMNLGAGLVDLHKAIYLAILVTWVALLWRDEPSAAPVAAAQVAEIPASEAVVAAEALPAEHESAEPQHEEPQA